MSGWSDGGCKHPCYACPILSDLARIRQRVEMTTAFQRIVAEPGMAKLEAQIGSIFFGRRNS